jgi:hypothetical protein
MPEASPVKSTLSPRKRQACLENLRKAWRAPRRPYEKTEKRLAASRANLKKAVEANRGHYRRTPKRLQACRENLKKARAAQQGNFRRTEARLRASRESIRKAQAAPRTPESYARSRYNHLQHGLTVRNLEATLRALGDDRREFEAHCARFRRVFSPANPTEENVVRRIAAAVWRQLRLFKAQARWQSDTLRRYFQRAEFVETLDAETTRMRALSLLVLILDRDKFHFHDQRLTGGVERALRLLLHLRTGGDPDFQLLTRESEKERRELRALEKEIEEQKRDLLVLERLARGGPEVEAAIERARQVMHAWKPGSPTPPTGE